MKKGGRKSGQKRIRPAFVLFILFLFFLLFSFASPPANAQSYSEGGNFFVDKRTVSVDEEVQFTVPSPFATTVIWNFGDGTQANGTSVNHTYDELGNYQVNAYIIENGTIVADHIVITVEISSGEYFTTAACWGCCFPIFLTPFLLLGVLLKWRNKKKDPKGRNYHFSVTQSVLVPILIASLAAQFLVFFYFPIAGFCGGFLMVATAFIFVLLMYVTVLFLKRTGRGSEFFSQIILIPRFRRKLRRFSQEPFKAFWDRINFAFHLSPMAMAISLFLTALVANQLDSIDAVMSDSKIFTILLLAPFLAIVIAPIQLLFDSSLVLINHKDVASAIQIRYLGKIFRRSAQSITGFSAAIAFVGVIIEIYTQNFLNWVTVYAIGEALSMILAWALLIYSGLWVTMFVYGFFHEFVLDFMNKMILKLGLPVYVISESRDRSEIKLEKVSVEDSDEMERLVERRFSSE